MRLTDDVRALMQPNDPAPDLPAELSDRARYTLEDILVSRPGAVSTRTGVGPTPRRSLTGWARRKWWVPLTVFLTASTGVAVALVYPDAKSPAHIEGVRCYTDTDLKARPFHGTTLVRVDQADNSQFAVEQCADMWAVGLLRPGAPRPVVGGKPPQTPSPVPEFVVCVVEDFAAVFPADPHFCRDAGLPPLAPLAPKSGKAG
ncbi:hypothetical protein [Yinghuangia seranimata]|uniref:hypothetical protein n=1 Tax=Yinghuangia seranimata TaxID=408067 RepID=UPI00248D2D61|nr:hypothetical protein [Yinghuangia seranimata]MDI2130786.1 hypothetical protein [Yinghuangia seranimata]